MTLLRASYHGDFADAHLAAADRLYREVLREASEALAERYRHSDENYALREAFRASEEAVALIRRPASLVVASKPGLRALDRIQNGRSVHKLATTPDVPEIVAQAAENQLPDVHAGVKTTPIRLSTKDRLDGAYVLLRFDDLVQEGEPGRPPRMTTAERDICRLLCQGKTTNEIGAVRKTSPATVKNQISTVLRKWRVRGRVELVMAFCRSIGLGGTNDDR